MSLENIMLREISYKRSQTVGLIYTKCPVQAILLRWQQDSWLLRDSNRVAIRRKNIKLFEVMKKP